MMTLEKFFSEEAARCEKLRVAVQFCYLCRSREIVTLSKEDFVVVSSPSMAVILSHFFPSQFALHNSKRIVDDNLCV